MTRSLRARQRELTQRVILEAAAEIVIEQGVHSFSIDDVAERAGVSARTLYRYFESREGLLLAIGARLSTHLTAVRQASGSAELEFDESVTLEQCTDLVLESFQTFSEHESLARATAAITALAEQSDAPEEFETASEQRRRRSARIRSVIARELPGVTDQSLDQIFAIVRLLASIHGWNHLTSAPAFLDGDDAATALRWALHALIERARQMQEDGIESLAEDMR